MKIYSYGEDGLTLKCITENPKELLDKLGDNADPEDCSCFFRVSMGRGRGCYGEIDAILATPNKIYLVESKWVVRKYKEPKELIKETQAQRNDILRWYIEKWEENNIIRMSGDGLELINWDKFWEDRKDGFKAKFKKNIPGQRTQLSKNLYYLLNGIYKACKDEKQRVEHVLLVFYRDKSEYDGVSPIRVNYNKAGEAIEFRVIGLESRDDVFEFKFKR